MWGQARTLAQISEKHIKEGDVDGLVGSSVVFDLTQHHLQPEHQRRGVRRRKEHREACLEKDSAAMGLPP